MVRMVKRASRRNKREDFLHNLKIVKALLQDKIWLHKTAEITFQKPPNTQSN